MLTPLPIRLFCDIAAPTALNDLNRNSQPPSFYRGDDIEIDIGIGLDGSILTSISNVASVTAQIFASENDAGAPQMSCTVLAAALNPALTEAEWTADTSPFCHAAFIFTNTQTAISLGGQASANFWLRVTVQTSAPAKNITILDGPITIRDGPDYTGSYTPPIAAQFRGYVVNDQNVLQLLDTTTGLYHTISVLNDDGTLTLQLSDQGY